MMRKQPKYVTLFPAAAPARSDTRNPTVAVELLVTLAEQAPSMMRKQHTFIQNMVPLALQLMLVVEDTDIAEWNATTDDDDDTDMTSREQHARTHARLRAGYDDQNAYVNHYGCVNNCGYDDPDTRDDQC